MSVLYNEHLTGVEREVAIIIAESNAEFARLNVLYEAINATHEANLLAAEAKVFAESGTYDDLTMLYTEAEKDKEEKEAGFFKTIWNAILNLFARIKKFLTGKNEDDIPDEVKIDKETENKFNIIEKAGATIKSGVDKLKNGDFAGAIAEFAKVVIPTAVVGGAVAGVVTWKKEKIKSALKYMKELQTHIENGVTTAKANIDKKMGTDSKVGDILKKALDSITKVTNFLFGTEGSIWSFIIKAKSKIKDAVTPDPKIDNIDDIKGSNDDAKLINQFKDIGLTNNLVAKYKNLENEKARLTLDEIKYVCELRKDNQKYANSTIGTMLKYASMKKAKGLDPKVHMESVSVFGMTIDEDEFINIYLESELVDIDCDDITFITE